MKKLLLFLSLFAFPFVVFARGFHHRQPTPSPVPVPVQASVISGMFNGGNETQYGTYSGVFVGDGDSFTADVAGLQGDLFVYWESNYTASQIANGSADSFLKNWSAQMKTYGQPIIFAPLDEMNGNWSSYYGNPSAFIAAWQRIHSFFSDSNVKFAYDPNVAFPGTPVSTFSSYYPGSGYVDIVGLDGFDFGGQTFSQVFGASLPAMQAFGKPLWLTSIGAVSTDDQSAFLQAAFSSGVQGIVYFSYDQFALGSTAISTLKSLE